VSRARGRGEFALLVCGPVVALLAIYIVAVGLPAPECGEGGGATPGEMTTFWILVAVASLAGILAAAARLSALGRRGLLSGRHLVGVLAVLLAGGVVVLGWGWVAVAGALIASGGVVAVASFLALLLAWLLGRGVDQVGVLLPVYLLSVAFFCYPAIAILVAVSQAGLGC
jgi:hypothetical protein